MTNSFTRGSTVTKIVFCGLDNMKSRKDAFITWLDYLKKLNNEELKTCLFVDGRLTAEMFQLFFIKGNDIEKQEDYLNNYLFDDEDVPETICTFKQTSHLASMIASFSVGFYTNWLSNLVQNMDIYFVPYFYEYYLPLNNFKHA